MTISPAFELYEIDPADSAKASWRSSPDGLEDAARFVRQQPAAHQQRFFVATRRLTFENGASYPNINDVPAFRWEPSDSDWRPL